MMEVPTEISPEVRAWAARKLEEDREFFENRAQFGSPIVKNIAGLILKIGEETNR